MRHQHSKIICASSVILSFLFVAIFLFSTPQAVAKKSTMNRKKGETVSVLKNFEILYFISQDLPENTAVLVRPESQCYCSCRDNAWSCTQVECEEQNRECVQVQIELGSR